MAESRPCVRRGVFFGQFGGCQDLGVVCSTASWASEEVKKANQREEAMLPPLPRHGRKVAVVG